MDMSQLKHAHYGNARQPSLAEMIQARMSGREQDALALQTELHETLWMPEFERRDKPSE